MSSCEMLSYNNLSADAFSCLVAAAAKYGVTIATDSGSASSHGFTVAWNYGRAAQTLTIQCTDSPFWAPCSTINGKINEEVEGCMG